MKFFGSSFLDLYFGCKGGIRKMMTFKAIDIRVFDYDARFLACFDLCNDHLLHYFFKINDFFVLLFYLDLDRKLKIFWK